MTGFCLMSLFITLRAASITVRRKKMCLRATFSCFIDAKGDFFFVSHCTTCTYACRQVDLLIANQKNFVSIVTVRVPLWKVFSVVTKTTIQRWHMSVAHSWLDAASRRRALHKQAPRQKLGAGGGNQRGDNEATENTKLSTAAPLMQPPFSSDWNGRFWKVTRTGLFRSYF